MPKHYPNGSDVWVQTRPQSVRAVDTPLNPANGYVPDEPLPMVRPIRHWPIDRASSRPLLLPDVVDMRLRRSPVLGPAVDCCWGTGARRDAVCCDACAMVVRVVWRVNAGKGNGELGVDVKGTSNWQRKTRLDECDAQQDSQGASLSRRQYGRQVSTTRGSGKVVRGDGKGKRKMSLALQTRVSTWPTERGKLWLSVKPSES